MKSLPKALEQAREGPCTSLDKLVETIAKPAEDVKPHAPKMITRRIDNEYIRH